MRYICTSIIVMLALLPGGVAVAQDSGVEAATDTSKVQPSAWKYSTIFGLNLAQSAYSNNWAGSANGSINWVLQGDATAEKQYTHWFNWSNLLQIAYGQTANQRNRDSTDKVVFDSPDKTTDKILLESTGRFTLDRYLDPYVGLRLESQFSDQTDPQRPLGFNPVRFSQAAGFAHAFIKTDEQELISRVGLSTREIFARDFVDATTTNTKSFTNVDGGVEWLTTVTQPMLDKSVVWKSRLLVFYPFFFSGSDDLKKFDEDAQMEPGPPRESVQDFWKAPDVSFENTFTAGITKHLNVNLYVQWVYQKYARATDIDPTKPFDEREPLVDSAIRKAGQFKQTLALGLTYQLF